MAWVQRGAAKEQPDRVELSKEDLAALIAKTEGELREAEAGGAVGGDNEDDDWETEDEDEPGNAGGAAMDAAGAMDTADAAVAKEPTAEEAALIKKYNLDAYDEEEDIKTGVPMQGAGMGTGLGGLLYHNPGDVDPYITMKDDPEDDDIDDFRIKAEDNLLICGQTEDVYSHLEVNVYEEYDDHLFVHHDIMLASYPLCLEWLDFDPEQETAGNMLAVGTMSPQIEVWDLDIVDAVEPAFVLGDAKRKTKKKTRGHRAEVMALAWNSNQRNLLVSGSADHTVKLWDLATRACMRTYEHHTDKVQALAWNPVEAPVIVTGAFDKTAQVFDTRNPEAVARWQFASDIESLAWNPHSPHIFLASTEDGGVFAADTRNPGTTLFTLDAHSESCSAVAFSRYVPGMMVTASADGTMKVWDVLDKPTFLTSRNVDQGALYCAKFSPDAPAIVALGGMQNGIKCYDLLGIAAVREHFSTRKITAPPNPVGRRPAPAETEDTVFATGEDPESDDESWQTVMEELAITPSETTVRKDAQIAQGKTPTAGVGKGKKKTKGKKGKKGKKK